MVTILIRTLIIYICLMAVMRFMGKRQLGELELSELVTTLLLSEIAALPITNQDIPLSHALLPILTLVALEVFLSGMILRFPLIRKLFVVRPAILIQDGVPDPKALKSVRISVEELLSQLRLKDVTDTANVSYAILEPNGQISVIQKESATQKSQKPKKETGIMHLIISDGKLNQRNLTLAGKSEAWVNHFLATQGVSRKDVFIFMVDDGGNTRLYLHKS